MPITSLNNSLRNVFLTCYFFSSDTKYDSGSGWPSFTSPYEAENGLSNVIERPENSIDRSTFRTEVICRKV